MQVTTIIKNGLIVTPTGVVNGDLAMKNGKIIAIGELSVKAEEVIDAHGQLVLPGMVDAHVHINEPGRSNWEDYHTGTQALAAGGTTSMVVMPLNALPARTTATEFNRHREIAEGQSYVDFALYGGLVPGNQTEIGPMAAAGAAGFKAFMATTGSAEPGDFHNVDDYDLYRGMQAIAKTGLRLSLHAENAVLTDRLAADKIVHHHTDIQAYIDSRPPMVEVEAVRRALYLAKQTGCKLHFVHLSTGEAVREVYRAQMEGQDVTCETCVHYLTLNTEDFKRIGPLAKCSPVLRTPQIQADLWQEVQAGHVNAVTSDHSPAPAEMKANPNNNIFDVWGGISGAQNNLDVFYDVAVKSGRLSLQQFVQLTAAGPAKLFGLSNKGELKVGADADITLLDPNQSYTLRAEDLYYKNPISAYVGRRIGCRVTRTLLRGKTIFELGKGFDHQPTGEFLLNHRVEEEAK
ncbi:allantoinase AllB [Lactobacillus sp. LC28-10]|uniref:Allantoinase n=1 Tax=Secundilactobacillus angelensis TaxID=2722706 RepID=A0ABX1KZX8_9LACO|nr:allantoinase AllB [Secundilactobacillus angelensis]MCH5463036.1 allantoinase AllB [Secundilactobacillus angelensis]NLR19502.1 allantoinase AllB [Secundilactobacillus angelensis]